MFSYIFIKIFILNESYKKDKHFYSAKIFFSNIKKVDIIYNFIMTTCIHFSCSISLIVENYKFDKNNC